MTTKIEERSYPLEDFETVAETPTLRVVILTLGPGHEVPWHWHSQISDRFFCLEGPMTVETRAPRHHYDLTAGQSCEVPAKTAHRVAPAAGRGCRFLVVQGMGAYDFVPVGAAAAVPD